MKDILFQEEIIITLEPVIKCLLIGSYQNASPVSHLNIFSLLSNILVISYLWLFNEPTKKFKETQR